MTVCKITPKDKHDLIGIKHFIVKNTAKFILTFNYLNTFKARKVEIAISILKIKKLMLQVTNKEMRSSKD